MVLGTISDNIGLGGAGKHMMIGYNEVSSIERMVVAMPKIANRVANMSTTIFKEINVYAAQYDTVNLGQGKPDFDGPKEMLDAAIQSMLDGTANQYAPGYGAPILLQSIAHHAQKYYDLDIDPQEGIVVTSGAAEGVYAAITGIVNEGDEVILIEPFFDTYLPAIEWAGGKPVFVPMHPPSWTFDFDDLRAAFNPNTKAIILNSPHNPTGRVFTHEELTLIADLCKEFDVIVISDEVYEHLTYDNTRHIPIATLPDMFERTITVSSGAKTFSMTGWKIGWAMGHPDLIKGVWRIHQNLTFAVNHPAQYGIAHGLSMDGTYYEDLNEMYLGKRQIIMNGLINAGIKVDYAPSGAFYIMGDFSDVYDGTDRDFAKWLIREYGVACIPPSYFFSEAHAHIAQKHARFSYCKNDDSLYAAVERLAKLKG
ncbi:MAG: aminotransferase class I/II-fold pyridoxal phosphate-dependent enzyme [Phototrophicaceae bacterium]